MNEGEEESYPLKCRYFTAIGLFSMKIVADGHRHVAYHNKLFRDVNVNYLE